MYNATVYKKRNGEVILVFVAEVDENNKILKSNAIQYTGLEGTEKYDSFIRKYFRSYELEIVKDNCEGYKKVLGVK